MTLLIICKGEAGMLLSVLLFFIGLLGGAFPLFFNRDGSSLIIIGFGAGLLLLHNAIVDRNGKVKNVWIVILLTVAASIAGISLIIFNALKFTTNFNKVLTVGCIILLIWEMAICIKALK